MNRLKSTFKNLKMINTNLRKLVNHKNKNNELFTLWVNDNPELPELQHLALKSMLLTGHNVTLYSYNKLNNVPPGIKIANGDEILDRSTIFKYKEGFNKGSFSGFANWFRAKRLYEKGGAWFDCDILAIKNLNEFNLKDNIISSQYNPDGSIYPNNAFLKLKKEDKMLNVMLNYMNDVKDNVKHGDTGPILLNSMIEGQYTEYKNYLVNPNFIASINFFDYEDYLKPTKDIVNKLNFNKIWGFHIWNAMFRQYGNKHERINCGFYYDLKEAIITSSTKNEYKEKIQDIIEIKT